MIYKRINNVLTVVITIIFFLLGASSISLAYSLSETYEQTPLYGNNEISGENIYVSTQGNDNNTGKTEAQALKTIDKALEVARSNSYINNDNVIINLGSGIHYIDSMINITNSDTSTSDKILYFIGNGSTISGGYVIPKEWTQYQNNIYSIRLNEISDVTDMYVDGERMVLAEESLTIPSENYTHDAVSADGSSLIGTSSKLTQSIVNTLNSEINNIRLEYGWEWTYSNLKLTSISLNQNNITCNLTASSKEAFRGKPTYGTVHAIKLKNSLALLDEQKEFYFDKESKTLYFYSQVNPNTDGKEYVLSKSEGLLNIVGTESKLIKNITFKNITFTNGTTYEYNNKFFSNSQGDAGNLEGGGIKDFRKEAVKIKYASNINFINDTFKNIDETVISMDEYVYNSSVTNSLFYNVKGSGIRVGGILSNQYWLEDNGTTLPTNCNSVSSVTSSINKMPCSIRITNNKFEKIGQGWYGSVATLIMYGNNVNITNNEYKDLPYSALSLGWGWGNRESNVSKLSGNINVANNKIINAMNMMYDGAPIYTLGYFKDGLTINNNYVYNSVSKENGYHGGIYLDEGTDNFTVTNNVIEGFNNWIDERDLSTVDYASAKIIKNGTISGNYSNKEQTNAQRLAAHLVSGANINFQTATIIDNLQSNATVKSKIDSTGYTGNIGASQNNNPPVPDGDDHHDTLDPTEDQDDTQDPTDNPYNPIPQENPHTGSFVSVIFLTCSLVIAIILKIITMKKIKIYKL